MSRAIDSYKRMIASSRQKSRFHDAPRLSPQGRSEHYRTRMFFGGRAGLDPSGFRFESVDDDGFDDLPIFEQINFCAGWCVAINEGLDAVLNDLDNARDILDLKRQLHED